jgi:hypothetical protein
MVWKALAIDVIRNMGVVVQGVRKDSLLGQAHAYDQLRM